MVLLEVNETVGEELSLLEAVLVAVIVLLVVRELDGVFAELGVLEKVGGFVDAGVVVELREEEADGVLDVVCVALGVVERDTVGEGVRDDEGVRVIVLVVVLVGVWLLDGVFAGVVVGVLLEVLDRDGVRDLDLVIVLVKLTVGVDDCVGVTEGVIVLLGVTLGEQLSKNEISRREVAQTASAGLQPFPPMFRKQKLLI